jgi:hypothetical protein
MKLKYISKLILNKQKKKTTLFFILVVAELAAKVKQVKRILRLLIPKIKTHSIEPEGFPPVRGEP